MRYVVVVALVCVVWVCCGWLTTGAHAEVTAVSPSGFVSEHELLLAASPERAYRALTSEVAHWWDPAHSFSGHAANFTLDARAGGCFCEALPEDGSVEHLRVVFAQPGVRLRLLGGLGPLQAMAVHGSTDFELTAVEGGTRLRYRYAVVGFDGEQVGRLAEPVDQVQLGQLMRLAGYLADGDAE